MASSDAQQGIHVSQFAQQDVAVPRLFNFDLPQLQQTHQIFPELADASSFQNVLDIASGTGEWAISAAEASPELHIVGIERDPQLVEYARAQADARGIKNVLFKVMDPFEALDLEADAFDVVNARYIVGMLAAEAWPRALQEFMRVTRPSGRIRLTETELPLANGIAFPRFGGLIAQALYQTKRSFSPAGRLFSITPILKQLLKGAGCTQLQQTVAEINFSSGWPAHDEVTRSLAWSYEMVQPFLVRSQVASQEELEQLYREALAEMQSNDFCAVAFSLIASGQKP